jgi:hypothetical protein
LLSEDAQADISDHLAGEPVEVEVVGDASATLPGTLLMSSASCCRSRSRLGRF